jgi:hypothetical protein
VCADISEPLQRPVFGGQLSCFLAGPTLFFAGIRPSFLRFARILPRIDGGLTFHGASTAIECRNPSCSSPAPLEKGSRVDIDLICPAEGQPLLQEGSSEFYCSNCGRRYPVVGGVVRMVDRDDGFYEGTYLAQVRFTPRSEKPWRVWPLWFVNSGYLWAVRRFVRSGGVVVELGCGGGVRYFGGRYRMVGCDLSFTSLRSLVGIYDCLLQANASECIPLPDGSVDAVVSSFFLEHLAPAAK